VLNEREVNALRELRGKQSGNIFMLCKQLLEFIERERGAEQISLVSVAAEIGKEGALLLSFHALGNDGRPSAWLRTMMVCTIAPLPTSEKISCTNGPVDLQLSREGASGNSARNSRCQNRPERIAGHGA